MLRKNKRIIVAGVALGCMVALLVQITKNSRSDRRLKEKVFFVAGCLKGANFYQETIKLNDDRVLGQAYGKCLEEAEKRSNK